MRLRIILFVLMIVCFSNIVFAIGGNAAYIVPAPNYARAKLTTIMQDMGFNVTVIRGIDVDDYNLSEFDFLLIGDGFFSNAYAIPVNDYPSLIMNYDHMDDWHWSDKISTVASSVPLKIVNVDQAHMITEGMPSQITAYTSCCDQYGISLNIFFLYRFDRSLWLHTVTSTQQNNLDQTISTAVDGTRLLDNQYSNSKSVYFGLGEINYWTADAETLFRQSIMWLIVDDTAPVISNLNVHDITNESAIISWDTDDNSNYTIEYGTDLNLDYSVSDSDFNTEFDILFDELEDNTTYYYNLTVCNEFGYCNTIGPNNFMTLKTPDMTAPELDNLNEVITNQSAEITFDTDDNSNVSFEWGISSSFGNLIIDSSYKTDHTVQLNGLSEDTAYYYEITVCNDDGYCNTYGTYDFITEDWTNPGTPVNLRAYVDNSDNSIILNWTAPAGETVQQYNVYISDSPELSSFDFNNPDASVGGIQYIDSDAGNYGQLFYAVRAEDSSGNEEGNSFIIGKFDISLEIGDNLVSIPLQPFDISIDDVMHEDNSYNPINEILREENDVWYSSSFDGNSWSGSISSIEMDKGYFFRSDSNADFTITGIADDSLRTVNLASGMNLVGWSSFNSAKLRDAIDETDILEVSRLDNDGHYEIAAYYSQNSPNYWYSDEGFDELEPGKGYWFKVNNSVNWGYSP